MAKRWLFVVVAASNAAAAAVKGLRAPDFKGIGIQQRQQQADRREVGAWELAHTAAVRAADTIIC